MSTKLSLFVLNDSIYNFFYKSFAIFFILNTSFSFSQTCNADLSAFNNRNSRSTSSSGTYFKMTITNKGTTSDVYNLSSVNINNSCVNSDGSSNLLNVNLNISYTDINLNSITTIAINAGETKNFLVHVTIPTNTPLNRWCCTNILATSSICTNFKVNATIHTLLINSNDD
jgi:uncharacterized membrane protein